MARIRSPHPPLVALCALLAAPPFLSRADVTYIVRKSDTLSAIALKHGTTAKALADFNGLTNPNAIIAGQQLLIPPGPGAPKKYVVKQGDTLAAIAAAHGVRVADIVTENAIARPDAIAIGQSISIPAKSTAPPSRMDADLKRKLDGVRVTRDKWKYIVVHHSATDRGTVKGMDEYHRKKRRMTNGLAYHFVIGNGQGMPAGEVEICERWRRQIKGGHLKSSAQNERSIGICLVGNFEERAPAREQMESLVALTRYLQQRCGIAKSRVQTHTEINVRPTKCPGRKFPTGSFMARL